MCQKDTFTEIVGEAGVVAGAGAGAAAGLGFRHWGSDSWVLLSLAQLLDQETLVTALLRDDVTHKAHLSSGNNSNDDLTCAVDDYEKTVVEKKVDIDETKHRLLSKPTISSCSLSCLMTLL